MKKRLLLLALIVQLLAFTGCGGNDNEPDELEYVTVSELESANSWVYESANTKLMLKFRNGKIHTKQITNGSVLNQNEIDYSISDNTTIKMELVWQKSYGTIWKTNKGKSIRIKMNGSLPLDSWISHTYKKSQEDF